MKRSFNGADTPAVIIAAARRVLARDGFAVLSARSVAAEAGTSLALLNYHFGSKENLLLAIFDQLDAERIARQREMYAAADVPLSQKWRTAVAFYRADLADGYVRILQELHAYGYSNPVIGDRVRQRLSQWRTLLADVAAAFLPGLGIDIDPGLAASAVASFWLGMEGQHLAGATEDEGRFFEVLDAVGNWLEAREQKGVGSNHARITA